MAVDFEESYDIDSDLSENDCRQDPTSIPFNESLPLQVTDETNKTNKTNKSNRLGSIDINIDTESQLNMLNSGRIRSQTVEIYSGNLNSSNWKCCGRCYRKCCFSALGIKITIFLNLLMILLNSGLIIYEIFLIIKDASLMQTKLPFWYMICDIVVTIILLIEMFFTVGAIYSCNLCKYFKSGWECWMDVVVLILSVLCCAAYYFDFTAEDIDNLTMLFVRVIRDLIRIIRCLWFFKMLYSNLIRLGIRKNTMTSFKGEPLLANKGWKSKYKLQINSSPKSSQSDQREYKGPKRVDIYDENDIKNMMDKQNDAKQGKMYSLTPSPPNSKRTTPHQSNIKKSKKKSNKKSNNKKTYSPPSHRSHQRNITRNCDEFRIEDIMNVHNEEGREAIISDDRSDIISINSEIIPGSNGSIIHHHQTSTKIICDTEPINSYNNDNESGLSYLTTTTTTDTDYDNLKLKHIKKKSFNNGDKQRLKELLKNLPSGSIIDRESFSIEFDENNNNNNDNADNHRLHSESDKLTFI